MKFLMPPGSCSTGIHLRFAAIALNFDVGSVNLVGNSTVRCRMPSSTSTSHD